MTYKELRQQKKEIQDKLNMANNTVSLQIEEIAILTKTINYQSSRNEILEKMFDLEVKAKNRAKLRSLNTAMARDKNYKNFINEVSKRNKREKLLNRIIIIGAFVITGLVAMLIKG
jgi:hypothetical protein